jgi:hypothetical protein
MAPLGVPVVPPVYWNPRDVLLIEVTRHQWRRCALLVQPEEILPDVRGPEGDDVPQAGTVLGDLGRPLRELRIREQHGGLGVLADEDVIVGGTHRVQAGEVGTEQVGGSLDKPGFGPVRAERENAGAAGDTAVGQDRHDSAHALGGLPVADPAIAVDEGLAIGVVGERVDEEVIDSDSGQRHALITTQPVSVYLTGHAARRTTACRF